MAAVMQRLDHVRAVLDDLMGHNRDGDMADYEIRVRLAAKL